MSRYAENTSVSSDASRNEIEMKEAPMFVTVSTADGHWGVGQLLTHDKGWWVDIKRGKLRFEDAADLRDAWNSRGAEKRP